MYYLPFKFFDKIFHLFWCTAKFRLVNLSMMHLEQANNNVLLFTRIKRVVYFIDLDLFVGTA